MARTRKSTSVATVIATPVSVTAPRPTVKRTYFVAQSTLDFRHDGNVIRIPKGKTPVDLVFSRFPAQFHGVMAQDAKAQFKTADGFPLELVTERE